MTNAYWDSVRDGAADGAAEGVAQAATEGAAQRGAPRFALPRCADCGKFHFYPRPACPYCHGTQVAPATASGLGSVYSYSIVYRAPSARFADQVPYVVALIATDEGPHMMSRVVGIDVDKVAIGQRVTVRFGLGDDDSLPVFQPVEEGK